MCALPFQYNAAVTNFLCNIASSSLYISLLIYSIYLFYSIYSNDNNAVMLFSFSIQTGGILPSSHLVEHISLKLCRVSNDIIEMDIGTEPDYICMMRR